MAAMDDGTGKLLAARFFPFEGASGICGFSNRGKLHGIPGAMYHDAIVAFIATILIGRSKSNWQVDRPDPGGLALQALEFGPSPPLSQPKGESRGSLDLAGPSPGRTRSGSNERPRSGQCFLKTFSRDLTVVLRCLPSIRIGMAQGCTELDLDRIISFRYRSVVANDNSIRIGGLILDIPPAPTDALTPRLLSKSGNS